MDSRTGDPGTYIYNTGAQTVAVEAAVAFSTNGLKTSGITHTAGSPRDIVFGTGTSGIYKVTYTVSPTGGNQMALFVHGVLVPGSIYGADTGTQQSMGMALVSITASDVLQLRNHTGTAALGLPATGGGATRSPTPRSRSRRSARRDDPRPNPETHHRRLVGIVEPVRITHRPRQ